MFKTLTFIHVLDSQMTLSKNSIYLNGRSERGAQEWWTLKKGATECECLFCSKFGVCTPLTVQWHFESHHNNC